MQTTFATLGTYTVINPQITPMTKDHLVDVVKIEKLSFPDPWRKKDFARLIKAHDKPDHGRPVPFTVEVPTCQGIKTVGYLIGDVEGPFFDILNLAIHPDWRRKRIMFSVIRWFQGQCTPDVRPIIRAVVCDDSPLAHEFFWACNFRAVRVIRGLIGYPDGVKDAYEFRWDVREDDALAEPRMRNLFTNGGEKP